jgi:hypothetical protein
MHPNIAQFAAGEPAAALRTIFSYLLFLSAPTHLDKRKSNSCTQPKDGLPQKVSHIRI